MLSLAQCVMVEYKILLMKMALDDPTNEKTKANFDLFMMCNFYWGLLLFSYCCSHNLIKFNQLWDVFICDFVVITKVCQGEINELYTNLNTNSNMMHLRLINLYYVLNMIQ